MCETFTFSSIIERRHLFINMGGGYKEARLLRLQSLQRKVCSAQEARLIGWARGGRLILCASHTLASFRKSVSEGPDDGDLISVPKLPMPISTHMLFCLSYIVTDKSIVTKRVPVLDTKHMSTTSRKHHSLNSSQVG